MAALALSEVTVEHIDILPCTISTVDLRGGSDDKVFLVMLSRDRLYTEAKCTLYVYSVNDLTAAIATYDLPDQSYSSGLIADNCLYIGSWWCNLIVYKISDSLTEPLKLLASIETRRSVLNMM
jgi:hypothetical protein